MTRHRDSMTSFMDLIKGDSLRGGRRGEPEGPAPLSEDDVLEFTGSATIRDEKPGRRNRGLAQLLKDKNFVRLHRMQKDFEWAQRMAVKNGYNPEEVRWLLVSRE